MTKARMVLGLGLGVGVFAVCCSWPDYSVRSAAAPDAETDGGALEAEAVDATPYDVASAFCAEAGIKSGEAVPCACSGAAIEGDADVGPLGQQTCTLEGGLGACVGCPAKSSCETVTDLPLGMTCIPGGLAVQGASNPAVCPPAGCAVEQPEHPVSLTRFFLDENEVSVKRFRDWWKNGHVTPKAGDVVFEAGDGVTIAWQEAWTVSEPTLADGTNGATWKGAATAEADALPVNYVDWPTALAFCATTITGGRLPTEAEWEAAASGREGRLFPREAAETRNTPPTPAMVPCDRALSGAGGADCGVLGPQALAGGRKSRDGAQDLAGSLAEWVLDVPPPGGLGCVTNCYPKAGVNPVLFVADVALRGVRGGAWSDTEPKRLRAQARDFKAFSTKTSAIGFRCVRR